MNPKYPMLSFFSAILKWGGLFITSISILFVFFATIVEPNQTGHSFGNTDMMQLAGGSLAIFCGIIFSVIGELSAVLVNIEENTRK